MDFIIVVTSLLQKFGTDANLSVLRTLRILRPLRTISKIKSLKNMLNAIFSSLSMLRDIVIIMIFFNTVFAVTG